MIRGTLTVLAFVSTIFFPWPLTVLLALGASIAEPLVPLAVGLFADTLYYVPQSGHILFTLYGLGATILAVFVRRWVKTSIIER